VSPLLIAMGETLAGGSDSPWTRGRPARAAGPRVRGRGRGAAAAGDVDAAEHGRGPGLGVADLAGRGRAARAGGGATRPLSAPPLKAVLLPLATPRNSVVGEVDGHPMTEVDPRHHAQRVHDALEEMCDRLLRSVLPPDSAGTPATVVVSISSKDLRRAADVGTTSDGTRLGGAAVAELAASAVRFPTVVDARGVAPSVGRSSRVVTPGPSDGALRPGTVGRTALRGRLHRRVDGVAGRDDLHAASRAVSPCRTGAIVNTSSRVDGGRTDRDDLTCLKRYLH
jgi:hypothetical protein